MSVIGDYNDRAASEGRLQAALDKAKAAARDEIGWLIEGEDRDGVPIYFTLERGDGEGWMSDFTHDSVKALRFARSVDANNFANAYIDGLECVPCKVVEHMWCAPPQSPSA